MKFLNLIPMVICGLSFAAGNAAGASPSNVVVIRFAVPSQTFADPKSLSVQACPGVTSEAQPATAPLRVDPKVLDAITEELQKSFLRRRCRLCCCATRIRSQQVLLSSLDASRGPLQEMRQNDWSA